MNESSLHLQLNRERFEISEAFLEKYNRQGPRYTSYPTAPVWQDDFGPDELEQFYATADAARTPVSLYMHLPFCESLCLFCACNVVIKKDHSVAPPYLATLEQEIDHVSRFVSRERPVVQFHWGGGTPTYLTPAQMEDLFGHAAQRFSFAPDAEIGIEVDPRVTSPQHLESLRQLGFAVNIAPDPEEFCNRTITVGGIGGKIPNAGTMEKPLELFVGNSGTAARFLVAFVGLGNGVYRLSGVPRMHERPQAALFQALRQLGCRVDSPNDKLPAIIHGTGLRPGSCQVSIEESSQFASALLMCSLVAGW